MKVRVLLSLTVLVLSGCIGSQGDVTPTTTAPTPPKPLQVFKKEVNACPGGAQQPVQTQAVTGTFEVQPGYDQIIIAFHEAGTGSEISAEIRWIEESNQKIWEKPKHSTPVPPVACGMHAHGGDGETLQVEPGNYTVRIQYQGTVSIHMEITARSSRANETASTHTHSVARW